MTSLPPETIAALRLAVQRGMAPFRADPRMPLSVWAEQHFMLDRDSSQQAGGWSCWPFQAALMDWMSATASCASSSASPSALGTPRS
jgi:terminase, large subunit